MTNNLFHAYINHRYTYRHKWIWQFLLSNVSWYHMKLMKHKISRCISETRFIIDFSCNGRKLESAALLGLVINKLFYKWNVGQVWILMRLLLDIGSEGKMSISTTLFRKGFGFFCFFAQTTFKAQLSYAAHFLNITLKMPLKQWQQQKETYKQVLTRTAA